VRQNSDGAVAVLLHGAIGSTAKTPLPLRVRPVVTPAALQ
jgi:hypothetical protein